MAKKEGGSCDNMAIGACEVLEIFIILAVHKQFIMKSILVSVLTTLALSGICYGQDNEKSKIFEKVKDSFNGLYPGALVKEWELEKNNIYEVEFTFENHKYEADFKEDGTWLYTERDININEVPISILNNFKISEWSSWKIEEVEEITSPQYDVLFELVLKKENGKSYLYYLPDGTLLEKSARSKF